MNLTPMDKSARYFYAAMSRATTRTLESAMRWGYLTKQRGPLRHCVFTVQPIEQGNSVNGYERIPLIRARTSIVSARVPARCSDCVSIVEICISSMNFIKEIVRASLLALICEIFIAFKFARRKKLDSYSISLAICIYTDLKLSNSVFKI